MTECSFNALAFLFFPLFRFNECLSIYLIALVLIFLSVLQLYFLNDILYVDYHCFINFLNKFRSIWLFVIMMNDSLI